MRCQYNEKADQLEEVKCDEEAEFRASIHNDCDVMNLCFECAANFTLAAVAMWEGGPEAGTPECLVCLGKVYHLEQFITVRPI